MLVGKLVPEFLYVSHPQKMLSFNIWICAILRLVLVKKQKWNAVGGKCRSNTGFSQTTPWI